MAERTVSVEFVFDRASSLALAQVYRSLVPERRARTAGGRNTDDDSQASTTSPGGASQRQLVAGTGADEDRAALGA